MEPVIRVDNLRKAFREGRSVIWAVNGVSLEIYPGEAVGLVGESGCGKTTTARCVLRLVEPTEGRVFFQGADMAQWSGGHLRRQRRFFQMVFQDPNTSLNPRFTVRRTLAEPLRLHGLASSRRATEEMLCETMLRVNLEPRLLERYPHQLSGGQKQRVGIARAIITNPRFIALDEPTSSLDMSIRIQILSLLQRLQNEMNMAYLFISHDLSAVRFLCSRVFVMYLGRVVEAGPVDEIFERPAHPYTRALLSAIPIPDPKLKRQRIILEGEPPSLFNLPPGCGFYDRCWARKPSCRGEMPPFRDVGDGHFVACFAEVEE
ncbi:MAG: ABC transporter ATP-binding protein [Chloroflexi bacterium]|nr:ABC transporter ATP-binding protein [Chloroflexota bacterium]